ncbi:hypothetical protein KFL_014640010 [Klebsormidium nitens]|uniref:CCHC-type domain-containing protein n=1 Tax=Klebsormidium nitens TaxID=105231 RepID=A0A1Y1IRQ6_KLENI|nr:hypothetical protein KFL_014640010 [Klebsormidium nitens]|eukprot:GAQ93354.1 hypothetical protein KFL_014640010 [Klebsormidium nitens]
MCYDCGKFGHIARKCSKPDRREQKPEQKKVGKPPKGVAFSIIEGVSTDEWLVDSGSSQHLTRDNSLFHVMYVPGVAADLILVSKATEVAEKFDVRDLGEAKYFLGMELTRDREARTLKLTQKKLTGELVGRYGLASARARSVPLGTGDKLTKEGEPLDTKRFPYVGALVRLMAGPTEEHWRAALGVVRYLAGTAEDGVTFGGSGEALMAYCDANYAGDVDTKRSTTGYVFLMYGGGRSKHIDVIHHFARERVARKDVALAYCGTEEMKADIMTKALAPGKFKKCKSQIGIA